MNFWDFLVDVFWIYIFFAFLMILFSILRDLFSDHTLSGGYKALWIIFLVFFPALGALVYLIARHKGMTARSQARAEQAQSAANSYIKTVAGTSRTDEISKAKALLDSGSITQTEYESLKAKALA